jgi:hypothetical protein
VPLGSQEVSARWRAAIENTPKILMPEARQLVIACERIGDQ